MIPCRFKARAFEFPDGKKRMIYGPEARAGGKDHGQIERGHEIDHRLIVANRRKKASCAFYDYAFVSFKQVAKCFDNPLKRNCGGLPSPPRDGANRQVR